MRHVENIVGMLLTAAMVLGIVYWLMQDQKADCRRKLYRVTQAESLAVIKADKWCAP